MRAHGLDGDRFDGGHLAGDDRLRDDARLECGICWHVYDPAEGDPVWQALLEKIS